MEHAPVYLNIDDHRDMIHEYKHSYNHGHLMNPTINFNQIVIN